MKKSKKEGVILLSEIPVGKAAFIEKIDTPPTVYLRLCDMGLNLGAPVSCLGAGPLGDPRAYLARGRVIAIRAADAKNIICKF